MPQLLLPLLAAFLCVSVFAALPESGTTDSLGVNIHFTNAKAGEMEMIRAGGFRWIRMDFVWSATEKTRGQYDFSAYDRLLKQLEAQQIRPLFILDYNSPLYDGNVSPYTDEGRAAFAKWAAAAARHFAGHGILWEMWNEPNIPQFWKPAVNVDDYIKLATATGRAIRNAAPGETFIGPATSTIDLTFLEACFKAGLLEHFDAVSVHPYRQREPESVVDEYRQLRLLIDRYAPKGKQIPILSGEWGYSSIWNSFPAERQATMLARQFLTNIASDIPLSIWYDWHDDGTNPKDAEHHFGTVSFDYRAGESPVYQPKPAYIAARTLTSQLAGYRFNKRLALDDSDQKGQRDWMLLFSKDDSVMVVAWTAAVTGHDATLPVGAGEFEVTSHLGESRPTLAAGPQGLRLHLSSEPIYLKPRGKNDLLALLAGWERLRPLGAVTAPTTISPALRLRNTLDKPISLQDYPNHWTQLAAGATISLKADYRILRSAHATRIDHTLRIEGYPEARQSEFVDAANPLSVTALPSGKQILPVRITKPADEQLAAKLFYGPAESIDVAMPRGVTQSLIHLPGRQDPYTLDLRLTDTSGAPLFASPARRYVALPIEGYGAYPDGDAKVVSQQTLTSVTDVLPTGEQVAALLIDYKFEEGWKFARIAGKEPTPLEGKPLAMGLWVKSPRINDTIRMRFADATGQTHQPNGRRLDFQGWEYVEFPLDGTASGHWGGANDGVVHYPIKLDTLFLVDSSNRKPTAGQITIALPTLVYAP